MKERGFLLKSDFALLYNRERERLEVRRGALIGVTGDEIDFISSSAPLSAGAQADSAGAAGSFAGSADPSKQSSSASASPAKKNPEGGALSRSKGALSKTSSDREALSKLKTRRILDFKNSLLCPGLVNTHTHIAMSLFRGLADDIPLKKWLENYIFPLEKQFVNEDFVYSGSLLSAAELIRSGITTVCDMYFHAAGTARALDKAGLRGIAGFAVPGMEGEPGYKEEISRLNRIYENNPRISFAVAPHAPYTVSPEVLREAARFSKERNLPFLIHVSESPWEQEEIKKRFGKTPVQHLHSLEATGPRSLFVHCVHVNKKDRDIMRETGTALSHNPESNMKLSSGAAPFAEAVQEGLTVGLGTDGAASNNNLDFFREMSFAAKLQALRRALQQAPPGLQASKKTPPLALQAPQKKLSKRALPRLSAEDILKAATVGGAKALRMEEEIGSLEKGKKADIIALDLGAPHFYPPYNLMSHLVYSASASDVSFVLCGGKVLMKDRKILSFNESAALETALNFGEKIQNFLKDEGRF